MNALWTHLAGRTRVMANSCDLSTRNYENPTKLAVDFTVEACRDPALAKKYNHTATSLFTHFSNSVIVKDTRYALFNHLSLIPYFIFVQKLSVSFRKFILGYPDCTCH